jgi:hypothetical protein
MNTMQIHQYRVFYTAARKAVQARHAEFEAERREWYENGDGAAPKWIDTEDGRRVNIGGKGYAFPVCIHGMSQWTDYDNICGGCEDGVSVHREASSIARSQYRRFQWVMSAPADLPSKYKTDLVAWMFEMNRA